MIEEKKLKETIEGMIVELTDWGFESQQKQGENCRDSFLFAGGITALNNLKKKMKIKHECEKCAEQSKGYAEWSKKYAERSKECAEWSKDYAEWSKACAEQCRCEK